MSEDTERSGPSRAVKVLMVLFLTMLVMWAFLPVMATGLARWLTVLFGAVLVIVLALLYASPSSTAAASSEHANGNGVESTPGPETKDREGKAGSKKGKKVDLRTYQAEMKSKEGEVVRTFVCPNCGGKELYYESGYITGQVYHCKDCDYVGSFVIEKEVELAKGTGRKRAKASPIKPEEEPLKSGSRHYLQ